jgi:hypothetical protein
MAMQSFHERAQDIGSVVEDGGLLASVFLILASDFSASNFSVSMDV